MKSAVVELEETKGPEAKTMGFPDKGFREKLVDFLGFCPRDDLDMGRGGSFCSGIAWESPNRTQWELGD